MHYPPIVVATAQATALASISNICAQLLDAYNQNLPYGIDAGQFIRFFIVTVLTSPPNFLWQAWLERTWPGRKPNPVNERPGSRSSSDEGIDLEDLQKRREGGLLDEEKGEYGERDHMLEGESSGKSWRSSGKLDWRNTWIKWFVDCITMGAILNTVAFLTLMGILKGRSLPEISSSVRAETIPLIVASYKIWPFASVVNFALIPVEKRIVFLSFVGLLWGVYMSLVAART